MKVCTLCNVSKSLSEFHVNPRYRFGVTAQCRVCRNRAIALWKQGIKILPKPEGGDKVCSACKIMKPVESFGRSSVMRDGRRSRCKECVSGGILNRLSADSPHRRLTNRLSRYGLSVQSWLAMIESQGGLCACCGKPFAKPFIDHNHETGYVRALVCAKCNNWLAPIENAEFMAMAVKYLSTPREARFRIRASIDPLSEKFKAREMALRRA